MFLKTEEEVVDKKMYGKINVNHTTARMHFNEQYFKRYVGWQLAKVIPA